ncbi:hypothetical protein K6U06_11695 [Acidiferrimicrobium sp. IK]|uniref:flagellar basal body rod protein FlgC n=1 Tax=Acidiferrimicrobium sp. IK TaxID=2871700 RepID=UPI0021CB73D0|nr:flagellar basal body rod C-terminal domain-containing protein [Acidiferrimicrobium sp. IK]MCU4185026.1 hypothetical protein [Acidiferrimicrobium sp. IK]
MSLFGALTISGGGIDAAQTWINTTASNVANANDVAPTSQGVYATEAPVFTPVNVGGSGAMGVQVSGVVRGSTAGIVTHDPSSPLADAQGNVRTADVSMSTQLVGLIAAQNDYQANARVLAQAKTAYQSALTLGQ